MSVHDVSESLIELREILAVARADQIFEGDPENRQLPAQMQHDKREERVEDRIADHGRQGAYKLAQPGDLVIGTPPCVVWKHGQMQETVQIGLRCVLHVVP